MRNLTVYLIVGPGGEVRAVKRRPWAEARELVVEIRLRLPEAPDVAAVVELELPEPPPVQVSTEVGEWGTEPEQAELDG